jgi:hypothetical protein
MLCTSESKKMLAVFVIIRVVAKYIKFGMKNKEIYVYIFIVKSKYEKGRKIKTV